jgi:hypothetical protein
MPQWCVQGNRGAEEGDHAEGKTREEQHERSAGEDRSLKPIYTPLDGGSTRAVHYQSLMLNSGRSHNLHDRILLDSPQR